MRTTNIYPTVARAAVPLLLLSLISNLAILISPLFMMQLLDRVIPSGNTATLLLLGALALSALAVQALVEASRDLSLGRLSRWTESEGTLLVLQPGLQNPKTRIEQIAGFSGFLGGPAAIAMLSLPWIPIYLLVLWMLHPTFLLLLTGMAAVFLTATLLSDAISRAPQAGAAQCAAREQDALRRAGEIDARGGVAMIAQNLRLRFAELQQARHALIGQSETAQTTRSAATGLVRNAGQILALAIGGWLVTQELISAGGMIAGSIITSKAYMTLESAMTQFPRIREAYGQYKGLVAIQPVPSAGESCVDDPSGELKAEGLIFPRGGGAPPRLDRVSLSLTPGECLAIVGNSGSGKTTLLRSLAGVEPAPIGSVYLGENECRGLSDQALYELVGYLPQQADLGSGTLTEAISCFEKSPSPERVVEAAKAAGVYGLISALPDSFETDLGAYPHLLSAGQAQRIALARAIYTKPKYLFLDEPNALLDADGERALGQTLLRLKAQGTTIVMVVHRSGILGLADKVLHLEHGRVSDFGKRSDVLGRLGIGGRQIEVPVLETSLEDLRDWIASHFTRATDQEFCQKAQRVGAELFQIACFNCPPDTLRFAKFAFKFVDDTQCELSMEEPVATDLDKKVVRLQSKLAKGDARLVNLPQDEAGLATVSTLSSSFQVTCEEELTRYHVGLSTGALLPDPERKAS